VTAQKDQLQALIRDIDRVLQQPSPKFSWGAGSQVHELRQVLQQVRRFLQHLLVKPIPTLELPPSLVPTENAQDVVHSVVQEMQELRSSVLRPLHNEVSTLMQQRTALLREVRQLEAQRNSYSQEQSFAQPSPAPATIERLHSVHDRTDQVLTSLDATLRVVFDSLQRDMQTYQDSLSQGLDKLHTLGQQSEVMFSGLVSRLAEQLGRDASSYLRPGEFSPESHDLLSGTGHNSPRNGNDAQAQGIFLEEPNPTLRKKRVQGPNIALPYAGTELHSEFLSSVESPSHPDSIQTLTELLGQLTVNQPSPSHHLSSSPVVYSVTPPEQTSETPHGASPELRSLVQSPGGPESQPLPLTEDYLPREDLPSSELPQTQPESDPPIDSPPIDPIALSHLSQDLSNLEELVTPNPAERKQTPPLRDAQAIFTLEGMDDLFVDEEINASQPED
jgi:hypothetical protein